VPYHWFIQGDTNQRGRLYHGYLNFCVSQLPLDCGNVLDAGCGDGKLLGEIVRSGRRGSFHGVDYSERAVGFARLLVPKASFTCSDLAILPYEDALFDTIFLVETLEHIKPSEIPTILTELARVLKKNGRLVVTVPSTLLGIPSPESKHYQHFTPTSLSETLTPVFGISRLFGQDKAGFHLLKVVYRMLDNALWDIKPLRRWYNKCVWAKYFNICSPEAGRRLIAIGLRREMSDHTEELKYAR
jgi:ubiquinone/menaquinone biosynthesis C-methylase UbiE